MNEQTPERSRQHIVLETETHSLSIVDRNRRVHLTQTEYRIFQALFRENLLSDEQLAERVFECSLDTRLRSCLDKHTDHLRAKIRVYGWDILRVLRYGYLLLPCD